jgi:putative ABC transport system substrate-binding protein
MIAEKGRATILERHPRKLMMRVPVILAAGGVAFLVTAALQAQKASDERGRVFAETNCARCHAIGTTGDSPLAKAPLSAHCTSATRSKTSKRRSPKGYGRHTRKCRSSRWTPIKSMICSPISNFWSALIELRLISMPNAARLNSAAARGETESRRVLCDLWPEMGECFLCGNPLAPGAGVTSIMRHPRCKPGAATSALKKGLASPSHGGRQRDAVLLRTPANYNATFPLCHQQGACSFLCCDRAGRSRASVVEDRQPAAAEGPVVGSEQVRAAPSSAAVVTGQVVGPAASPVERAASDLERSSWCKSEGPSSAQKSIPTRYNSPVMPRSDERGGMRRRDFLLCSILASIKVNSPALAQGLKKIWRLGVLSPIDAPLIRSTVIPELARRGFVEGQNLVVDTRIGGEDQLPHLAGELVSTAPDAIVAVSDWAVHPAREATNSIPIIMSPIGTDPVAAGIVESWARPGGNVTGTTLIAPELEVKRLELLREVVPNARRIALLSMHRKVTEPGGAQTRNFATKHDIQLIEGIQSAGAEALVLVPVPEFSTHAKSLADLALKASLPTVCGISKAAEQGFLLQYGPDPVELARFAADYVDRIFRGASPGELPIQGPTHYEFAVNLKTARALGLAIPQSILARADEVIE